MLLNYIVLLLAIFTLSNAQGDSKVSGKGKYRGRGGQQSSLQSNSSKNSTAFSNSKDRQLINKIINGSSATKAQYPFIVQLFTRSSSATPFAFSCTGSLISNQWVLTAAHCVTDSNRNFYNPSNFRVAAGNTQLIQGSAINSQYQVASMGTFGYKANPSLDLALLKLKTTVPASISTPARFYTGPAVPSLPVTVAGFGVTKFGSSVPSNVLLQTRVDISQSSNCSAFNSDWTSNTGPQLCQESYNGDDSCQGDSGGPLVTNVGGQNVIVGITNDGGNKDPRAASGCGYNIIAYYARLGYYASAISKVIGVPLSTLTVS
ncbi:hypothetical protein BB560_006163 [Smittium megazygosporum]|uniref:Peptidase S1 domain-containing protein n=1 Tax=Smittium megazygosporum TaxID=133381 RepID=A0A2T9YF37_9FUNG|nr:hypothetical protein BB560_006163 [Smittium megazygosporum]